MCGERHGEAGSDLRWAMRALPWAMSPKWALSANQASRAWSAADGPGTQARGAGTFELFFYDPALGSSEAADISCRCRGCAARAPSSRSEVAILVGTAPCTS